MTVPWSPALKSGSHQIQLLDSKFLILVWFQCKMCKLPQLLLPARRRLCKLLQLLPARGRLRKPKLLLPRQLTTLRSRL